MASGSSHDVQAIKGAYFPSWDQDFTPSSINTKLFTHIYYAFLIPDSVTFKFNIDQSKALQLKDFTSTLSTKKTFFSVGGASEGNALFSRMASDSGSRMNFINSSIQVARTYGFHGIDLDWEFPETPKDMENLGYLLDEWRVQVQREAEATGKPRLLLAAAVYYSTVITWPTDKRSYPSASMGKNLDWINIMSYDYHGSWDTSATGAPAALYDPKSNINTSYCLNQWIQSGVPRTKIIMGLPLYGRTWQLKDPNSHGIGAPAVGVGPGRGELTYAKIVNFNKDFNANEVYDSATVSAYSVAGTSWIGYDDAKSVQVKVGYARALGIGGYFFWAVNGDYNWIISETASKSWSP